jgi:hypothetical protein
LLDAKHITGSSQYARSGDLCRIFYEEIDSLYLLSLLLTADREKAEQCFLSGLEDSVNGNPVFKEWARSWARRTIIQNAVRVINPRPMEEDAPSNFNSNNKTLAVERAEVATVLELGSFERFVYVMSVLEHYSDQDCSVLLGCTLWDVIAARIRTLQQIEVRRNFTVSGKCRLREGRTA